MGRFFSHDYAGYLFYIFDERIMKTILIESILSGIWATCFMDLLARFLSGRGLLYPFIIPEALGRWFRYMLKGKFRHGDINRTPEIKNEYTWYYVSHYLIGILLAGIYLVLAHGFGEILHLIWLAPVFGILTVSLPWFWLLPSIGLGVMARNSAKRYLILRTNFINHTNFGLGLFLWMILFHHIFSETIRMLP